MVKLTFNILKALSDHKYDKKIKCIAKEALERSIEGQGATRLACFATHILKKRWPEAERYIASRPAAAFSYAFHVVKGRFLLGERTIAQDEFNSYKYGRHIWGYRECPYKWIDEVFGLEYAELSKTYARECLVSFQR